MAAKGPSPEGAALSRHVHDFIWDYVPSQLTPSEHTRRSYMAALSSYVGWLGSNGVTPATLSASDFSAESIERWLGWLASERRNSPQTCNVRLAAIRAFARYASRHDASFAHLEAEAASVPQRKAAKRKVEGMSEGAVRAIAHAPDQGTRSGRRDAALIAVLYATACRIGELLSMTVSQLRLDDAHPHAIVVGKGNKARCVYLPDRAVEHMRAYLDEFHGEEPDPDAYVFFSRNHPPGQRPLSRDAVAKMLRKHAATAYATCADVPLDVTPHRFRHARATHWLERGMRLAQISLLLGHASIEITMAYLDVTVDAEAEAMQSIAGIDEPKRWKGSESTILAFCGLGR